MWILYHYHVQDQEFPNWLIPGYLFNNFSNRIIKHRQTIAQGLAHTIPAVTDRLFTFPLRTHQFAAKYLTRLSTQIRRLSQDAVHLWKDFLPQRRDWPYISAVFLLMCAAMLVRGLFLNYPMRYDESYTVTAFAMRPWLNLVSDYSLPNNHIFHTVLVKLSINIFGPAPWAVRMPALISGILCVPAGYVLARQLYGRTVALLSAGLIAALPLMISYSTNARGYSQYALFSLILFCLAIYLIKHANLAGWILFIFVAVLGFYTIPLMIFPFGGICLWLVVSAVTGETQQAYGSLSIFLKFLVSAGIITTLFTLLLYSPVILIGSGLDSLVSNPFVTQLDWADFWPQLGEQLKNVWLNWNYDLPRAIQILLAAGVVLSLTLHRWITQIKIPFQITILVWNLGLLILLRRNPLDRIWLFAMPFWLIWACGGLIAPLNYLKRNWRRLQLGLVAGILIITAVWSVERVHTYFPGWQPDPGKVELTAEYLSDHLAPGDAVAVVFPYDAQYWYYLGRLGVADEFMHQIELDTHKRVFAVVNKHYSETPDQVLQAHGLSPEEYQADEAVSIYKINDQEVYLCLHR